MNQPLTNPIQAALEHHKAGRLPQAEALYRQVLEQNPDQPDALYLLGVLSSQAGRNDLAVDLIRHSVRIRPSAQVYYDLGNLLQILGRHPETLESYENALKLKPDYYEVLNNRGNLMQHLNRYDEALADYDRSLAIAPDFVVALNNKGNTLQHLNRTQEAIECYKRAIALRPDYVESYYNYGHALSACGRLDEAAKLYLKALALRPRYAEAHNNLGNVLRTQGKTSEAIEHFRKAIEANPRFPEAYNNLGNAYNDLGYFPDAITNYKKTLELNPDNPDAYYNMGQALRDMGQTLDAIACYDKALALRPLYPEARWAYAMVHIPLLLGKHENLGALRAAFMHQLEALDRWFDKKRTPLGYQAVGVSQPFYLAYQEENNRDILSRHGNLCVRLMKDWQQRNHYEPISNIPAGPIRLGIVSSHLHNHSVWYAIVKGWLQHLNRNLIEIHVFYVGVREDDETRWAIHNATSFEKIGKNLDHAVNAILAKNLDVLIYPEIGMEQMAQQLASLRLCPAQLTCWGHPETSGLSTIDYYLSADDFEPLNAIDNYSELLIRLPHLGCCYHPLDIASIAPDFQALGLKANVPLLLSPGVPFKYAPQHDHVFIDIAKKLGTCQIVFFTSRPSDLSDKLKARLKSAFEKAGMDFDNFCIFIPWLDRPVFYGLMKRADVFLDTIGFSGFNTAMQAVECGLPIVARDGKFMRGRLGSGILRRMGLKELITDNNQAYVDLAVRLATDKEYQKTIRHAIQDKRGVLFNDQESVKALEQLLINLAERV